MRTITTEAFTWDQERSRARYLAASKILEAKLPTQISQVKQYKYIGRNRRNPRGLSIPNGAMALGRMDGDVFKVQVTGWHVGPTRIPFAPVYLHGKLVGDWSHFWHATNRNHWVEVPWRL